MLIERSSLVLADRGFSFAHHSPPNKLGFSFQLREHGAGRALVGGQRHPLPPVRGVEVLPVPLRRFLPDFARTRRALLDPPTFGVQVDSDLLPNQRPHHKSSQTSVARR